MNKSHRTRERTIRLRGLVKIEFVTTARKYVYAYHINAIKTHSPFILFVPIVNYIIIYRYQLLISYYLLVDR